MKNTKFGVTNELNVENIKTTNERPLILSSQSENTETTDV